MKINYAKKEAHFTPKNNAKCEIEEVKQTIATLGYSVSAVKLPATEPTKETP